MHLLLILLLFSFSAQANEYAEHCAVCHGADRLGGMGPALLPDNLGRLKPEEAGRVIREGRLATQMPGFGQKLTAAQVESLVALIYAPLAQTPTWGEAEIRASRVEHHGAGSLPDKPVYDADPLNLFVVVELGDHHATILDGDRFEPLARVPTRYALHGGPKFSPDGRFVHFASRDGWITRFDLWNLVPLVEVRAGINTRNLAVSSDGRVVAVANTLPRTIVLLDAETLTPLQVLPVADEAGKSSRVSAIYSAPPRNTFIAALKDVSEAWEIPMSGGSARRIGLEGVLDDFFFDPTYRKLIGASRETPGGRVVDLDSGQTVARLDLPGMPHLGSGITWERQGRRVMATPNLKEGLVTVMDLESGEVVKKIPTLGPGFFMRSHEGTSGAWVDASLSPAKDKIQILDKERLEVVATLTPEAGKTASHVEFSRDGKYALVSVSEMEGALVIYDARTLSEVKRLPMKKPSGKYNVFNKITRSEGTSH